MKDALRDFDFGERFFLGKSLSPASHFVVSHPFLAGAEIALKVCPRDVCVANSISTPLVLYFIEHNPLKARFFVEYIRQK